MKKVFTVAAIALFMITSCSDDSSSNNNSNSTDGVLLKKKIETDEDGSISTFEYNYDGNKLMSMTIDSDGTNNDYLVNYTYSNNKLSKMEYMQGNQTVGQFIYSYNNQGKLSSLVDTAAGQRTEYTYNSNGTISTVYYTGDSSSQTDLLYEGVFTFVGGNITKEELSNEHMNFSDNYTYDGKNSPMKNVFAKDIMDLSSRSGGPNNILSHTVDGQEDFTATYTYNSSNYPTASTETTTYNGNDEVTTTQYFYE